MNYRRSRVYTAPVPKMPPGLLKLMEGLSEDVLRNNPSNIYEFCADHVQKLLQIRDDRQQKKATSLQQKIAKAQNIIRERAKQRRKCYEKNHQAFLEDNETRPAHDVVNDDTEDASVAKREMVQHNLPAYTSRREEITRELFDNNITYPNIVSGECRELQLENSNSKNNTFIEHENECTSDVSGMQLTKGAVVVSPTVIENTNVLDEELCSTDLKIHHKLTSPDYSASSGTIENIDLEPKIPKEFPLSPDDGGFVAREDNFEGLNFSEEAENVCHERDAASSVVGAHHQMDLETAAITIQKVFRTFLFKSKTTSLDDATNVDINLFIEENDLENNINMTNKERRGISRMDTVLQTVNEEKSLSLSTDDSSTLSSAATIIQAHIRGFLVRNKLNFNKTPSTESMIDSKDFSGTSLEKNNDLQKTKTVLNIHIVPEKDNFPERDESFTTSMDLSMDESLHLLSSHASYDIVERRKQLKREDAIHSVTPPSNTSSSKLSEDMDSVREQVACDEAKESEGVIQYPSNVEAHEGQTAVEIENNAIQHSLEKVDETVNDQDSLSPLNVDSVHKIQLECTQTASLKHSSEFHEVILPTKVTRSDTSVVREFNNVLAYLLLWDYS